MNTEIKSVEPGQDYAYELFPLLKAVDESISDEQEKILWWAGFFCTLGVFAAGCIGTGAIVAIDEIAKSSINKVISNKSH